MRLPLRQKVLNLNGVGEPLLPLEGGERGGGRCIVTNLGIFWFKKILIQQFFPHSVILLLISLYSLKWLCTCILYNILVYTTYVLERFSFKLLFDFFLRVTWRCDTPPPCQSGMRILLLYSISVNINVCVVNQAVYLTFFQIFIQKLPLLKLKNGFLFTKNDANKFLIFKSAILLFFLFSDNLMSVHNFYVSIVIFILINHKLL